MAIVVLSSIGCATTDDPRKGGFIDGFVAVFVDGSYEKRIQKKENELKIGKKKYELLENERREIDKQKVEIKNQLQEAQTRLSQLREELKELDMRLKVANNSQGVEKSKYEKLKSEIEYLSEQASFSSSEAGESPRKVTARIKELENRKRILEKALGEAIEVY